ncbi:MAG TPA: PP2C family protein-serine/threonine phosphatase [Bryobacteraceae bacterium]|nr:PP2C family protein-serine/threonine phosphatase [Bryobacteraceae bacterium]
MTIESPSRSPRWFNVTFWAGIGLGLLLLGNSVVHYRWVSQRVVVDQVRRDLSAQAVEVDKLLQAKAPATRDGATALLEQVRRSANGRIAWIQIRDGRDTSLAAAGLEVAPTFPAEMIRSRLRVRQPVFETRAAKGGSVVVEAFPIRMPAPLGESTIQLAAYRPAAARGGFAVIEIAAYLNGAGNLWPMQRNLILNSSAAMALLGALVMMRTRLRSYLEGQRLAMQVEHARRVQQDLLPARPLERGDFEVSGSCSPAAELSGDFYDVFQVRGTGTAFVLGDVSGKGMPAAVLAGVMQGAVRSSQWAASGRRHVEATRQINRLLCERAARERYASMFWAYFVPELQVLRYVNAGHLPPLLIPARTGLARWLQSGGPVLGLLDGAAYEQGEIGLEAGDVLAMYSDGIVEACGADGEPFGKERMAGVVREHARRPVEEIREAVLAAVRRFTGDAEWADDHTLLLVKRNGG